MRAATRHLLLLGATFTLGGCGSSVEETPLPAPDRLVFEQSVQPILEARCGNPTTCHGNEGRPFAIYARRSNRLAPEDVFRDPPLTKVELEANYDRVRSFTLEIGDGPLLLNKPLAEEYSGVFHEGGTQFYTPDDREFRVLEEWIR